jgi:hypothetical protein
VGYLFLVGVLTSILYIIKHLKFHKMKKVIFALALATAFASCGGSATAPAADTTKKDTVAAPVVDTTKKDTTKVVVDSTKMVKDTTKK